MNVDDLAATLSFLTEAVAPLVRGRRVSFNPRFRSSRERRFGVIAEVAGDLVQILTDDGAVQFARLVDVHFEDQR